MTRNGMMQQVVTIPSAPREGPSHRVCENETGRVFWTDEPDLYADRSLFTVMHISDIAYHGPAWQHLTRIAGDSLKAMLPIEDDRLDHLTRHLDALD